MSRRPLPLAALVAAAALATSSAHAELKQVGADVPISGKIGDMAHGVTSSGYRFHVGLNGLTYNGRVERALLEEKDDGRVTVWLALRDIILTINSTSISGRPGSAHCGPLDIQLGYRRDLWVAFDFDSIGDGAQTSLKLEKTRFALPDDNWSVGSPAWVRTSGFGMSRAKVVRGLRGGLLSNKHQIEQRLIQIAPAMLARIAPVAGGRPVNRETIAPAVERLLTALGEPARSSEPALAAGNIEG